MKSKLLRAATLVAATASILASVQAQPTKPAARTIVEEIKKQVGVEWKQDTVDTFKAGNPDTPVTGIAVTMMATMDVLERAAAKGLNLVITHEPIFYAHVDTPDGLLENDPVWSEKRAFKDTTWTSGASTTTGTCATPMASKPE